MNTLQKTTLYSLRLIGCFLLLVMVGLGSACSRQAEETPVSGESEKSSLIMQVTASEAFDAAVLQSDLPVLVDFWATWCPPCRMMEPILEEMAVEQQSSLRIVKVDVDESPALAQRFNIEVIPTLMLFQSGKAIAIQQGAMRKETLLEWISHQLPNETSTTQE